MTPEVFRDLLYSLSGLSFGAAIYAMIMYAFAFCRGEDRKNAVAHILVKVSWLLVVGAIFKTIIIPITAIPPSLEGWIYAAGLLIGFFGFVGVAHAERRRAGLQEKAEQAKRDLRR